ncbi:NAD(P)-dependent oxidoreductase [Acuticoccus sediminis]|uniref:NAD(P)-dependent oxidoreductase n=1 Tax=Acuticoccus sediminis TaxID=2184697 RepID=A0A8B2NIQ6_9HYPH|nr:SDR family NAD(P)-dependent oxidoreductase [Acuticoccus sediminis]RAH97401.1 NAD(P)-dependent oxidoreductase [Acuticoccus sediminis]
MSAPRTALVTGAARGIGAEIARRLVAEGHHVILADILPEVEARADEIAAAGGRTSAVTVDLSDLASIAPFMAALVERHGAIDIVVNNAGISPKHDGKRAPVQETALAEWQSVLDVNLTAPFLICKAAVPGMRAKGWGRIVNMSSQAARTKSTVAGSHYAASKAGLVAFSRTLAGEVGHDGVTVNCIAPGRIETPMAATAGAAVNTAYVASIPVGRIGTTEDVAEAVAYLASDGAGFVTGIVLDVNGGHFMG